MGAVNTDLSYCSWPQCRSHYRSLYGPISDGWKFGPLGLRLCPIHSTSEHKPNMRPLRLPRGEPNLLMHCGCGIQGREPHHTVAGLLTEWSDHVLSRKGP